MKDTNTNNSQVIGTQNLQITSTGDHVVIDGVKYEYPLMIRLKKGCKFLMVDSNIYMGSYKLDLKTSKWEFSLKKFLGITGLACKDFAGFFMFNLSFDFDWCFFIILRNLDVFILS